MQKVTKLRRPKKKIEAAHHLIQRMSPTEKRHFKLYNQIYKGKGKDFIKLFDFLNKMTVYDSKRVESFFTKEKITRRNIVISYLLDKTLETIDALSGDNLYGSEESVMLSIRKHMVYHRFELYDWAYKELQKAEEIALKHDLLGELLDIYKGMLRVIMAPNSNPEGIEEFSVLVKKRETVAEKWMLNEKIDVIWLKILRGNSEESIKEIRTALNECTDQYNKLAFTTKLNFNLCDFVLNIKQLKLKKANTAIEKNVHLLENNPMHIEFQWDAYLSAWYNLIRSSALIGRIEKGCDFFSQYQLLPKKHKEAFDKIPDFLLISHYYRECLLHTELVIAAEKYNEITAIDKKVQTLINKHPLTPTWVTITNDLLMRLAYGSILIKKYARAHHWINILEAEPNIKNARIYTDLELLKLILYHEEKTVTLLTSLTRSLNRKWNLEPPENLNAMLIIKLMKQLQAKRKQKPLVEIWENACQKALKMRGKYYFILDFSHWLRQKI